MTVNAELTTRPELIPGIYNYCDSWCERCAFTNRCRSFQLQQQAALDNPNASLIQQLTEALDLTRQYIDTLHRSTPSDQTPTLSLTDQLTLEETALSRRYQTREQPAAVLATAYLKQTGTWLTHERNLLERAGRQQLREVNLGVRSEDEAMVRLNALKDAYQQIR